MAPHLYQIWTLSKIKNFENLVYMTYLSSLINVVCEGNLGQLKRQAQTVKSYY